MSERLYRDGSDLREEVFLRKAGAPPSSFGRAGAPPWAPAKRARRLGRLKRSAKRSSRVISNAPEPLYKSRKGFSGRGVAVFESRSAVIQRPASEARGRPTPGRPGKGRRIETLGQQRVRVSRFVFRPFSASGRTQTPPWVVARPDPDPDPSSALRLAPVGESKNLKGAPPAWLGPGGAPAAVQWFWCGGSPRASPGRVPPKPLPVGPLCH
ncbi:hypothetical protein M885DRAFT_546257 [Pelagophyceae sp. CCMP2097]|nr:hypothetical protein M885DRAFT_546257 [Pelagophyceae sp. CCMP2097]